MMYYTQKTCFLLQCCASGITFCPEILIHRRKIDIQPEPEPIPASHSAASDLIPFVEPVAPEPALPPAPPPAPSVKKPAPRLIPPKKKAVVEKEAKPQEKYIYAKQEVMQFEPVTRGRFEKSEPTIVEGQDLDVPTFLRKNIRVK